MSARAVATCVCLLMGLAAGAALPQDARAVHLGLGAERRREECHNRRHRKTTLKLIKEQPFAGLFRTLKNSSTALKFEASGLARVRGEYWVVFDNAMAIGHMDDVFRFRDPHNVLVGDWEPESQFEGIAYVPENDTFLLLHETLRHHSGAYKPFVREVRMRPELEGYDTLATCQVDYEFEEANKGFESIQYLHTQGGQPHLLGLCEGNWCQGGEEGRDRGHGRIIVSTLQWKEDGSCVWEPMKTIDVPEGAFFQDYSAMAYNYETRKLAIVSQEDAAVWIGDFNGDELEFMSQEGQLFHLPRDNHCQMIYCNAEGIQWVDNYRLAIASDKAKVKQPYWCDAKDQSVHLFSLPPSWDPWASAAEGAARLEREVAEEDEAAARGEL